MEPTAPYMLFTSQIDQPGMIGKVGTIAGEHDANISFMEVGRDKPRGKATMIVGLDDEPTDEMMEQIRAIPGMTSVRVVHQELSEPVQARLRSV
jgi:D-3-phosphoglycerate dehydrogenase